MTEPENTPAPSPDNAPTQSQDDRIVQARAILKATGDGGASWFFWIAGLSLVNTAIAHSGGDRHFIVGLAVTAIVDAIAVVMGKQDPQLANGAMAFAIGFSIFIAMSAVLFGWLSRKRIIWIFGLGMSLYLLDGLLYLLLGDLFSAGFHGYALFSMFQGFKAYRQLKLIDAAVETTASEDVPLAEISRDTGFETA